MRLSEFGKTLGRVKRHVEDEAALPEAYKILEAALGAEQKRAITTLNAVVDLYESWHAAEPGGGYDTKPAEWRAKLPKPEESDDPQAAKP